jgi:hypothetical protein
MIFVLVARVTIATDMMGVIVRLKQAMLFYHPDDLITHKRLQQCRRKLCVTQWGKLIAYVVYQGRDYPINTRTFILRTRCGLERVLQPINLVSG